LIEGSSKPVMSIARQSF